MRLLSKRILVVLLLLVGLSFLGGSAVPFFLFGSPLTIDGRADVTGTTELGEGWSSYGGDMGGHRFSSADQVTPENVARLQEAWRFSTGDMARGEVMGWTASEATPLLVDDKLVFCTPFNDVIALHPGTGQEIWRHELDAPTDQWPANLHVCRGISAHTRTDDTGTCPKRILMGTNNGLLVALDAQTGTRCADFGDNGIVTLDPGKDLLWPGEFHVTSPPVVAGQTVVVGSSISDNERVDAPVGAVRAYDAITGELRWTFDPIPRVASSDVAGDWQGQFPPVEGGANAWAPMSYDPDRGLVFVPTSSPSPDFYGGGRPGDNRHANSVVALKAETGDLIWARQLVHHDVWDYDLPAQPGLYQVTTPDGVRDVVAQVTKTGHVFVLDRDTGEPVLPIEERAVPQRAAPGEALSPTQPFPAVTPAIVPSRLDPSDAFGLTIFDRLECRQKIRSYWSEGLFSAPTEQGTILYPFSGGGANWGGAAYDPTRNLLVVNMSNLAHIATLVPRAQADTMAPSDDALELGRQAGAPYAIKREILLSSIGLPCSAPPFGVIAGVDLASGEIVWRSTLGTAEAAIGLPIAFGTPNFGGPIITAGGVVFIGAAMDDYLRAFDVATGQELWKGRLPAGGQATPMTYEWDGRQYIVIYAGGHARVGTTLGDSVIAFALP